jgi:hypothetical protein
MENEQTFWLVKGWHNGKHNDQQWPEEAYVIGFRSQGGAEIVAFAAESRPEVGSSLSLASG